MAIISRLAIGSGIAAIVYAAASGGVAAGEQAGGAFAARCSGLEGKSFGGAAVTSAGHVAAGTALPPFQRSFGPAFCRVKAVTKPAAGSEIKFEIWLPDDWNGKFVGIGGGGFEGSYAQANIALRRPVGARYAAVVTNAGHDVSPAPKWALGHPERIADFGHRANHLGARFGKAVVADYYGAQASRSIFHGCSNGGRDALMLAQRYPADYDAIAVGAPANDFSGLMASFARVRQMTQAAAGSPGFADKLKHVRAAAIAKCDRLDGAADGIIGNPASCRFDPAKLACKAGASGDACLTASEVAAVKAVYAPVALRSGALVMPGLPPGSEYQWESWLLGKTAAGPGMATNFYRYFVHGDPEWDPARFDLDSDWRAGRASVSPAIDALDPDISPFLKRGGKLLIYHGWDDAAIPAGNTLRYDTAMRRAVGPKLAASTRLFMLPGVAHCAGGEGPDTIDYIGEVDRWAESGTAPDRLTATQFDNPLAALMGEPAKQVRTRPVCAWPKSARNAGKGPLGDASSWVCR